MQRFLRKPPQRVTLATLLGVYRAVMRLSSIVGALDDAFEDDAAGDKAESGPALFRERIVSPLKKVSRRFCCCACDVLSSLSGKNCYEITDVCKRRLNSRLGGEPQGPTLRICSSPCRPVRTQRYFDALCLVFLVRQAVFDLSKFQSLCEEVIDLDHLRESDGKQVRVRPSFHAELQRLGQELAGTSEEMASVLKDVETSSKVCGTPSSTTTRATRWVEFY